MSPTKQIGLVLLMVFPGCAIEEPPEVDRPRVVIAGGVGDEPDIESGRPVAFADGGLVLVINPIVHPASTGALAVPPLRADIGIDIGPRGTRTDNTGLAVLDDLAVGTSVVEFPSESLNVSIDQVGLVDIVALYNPDQGPERIAEFHYPRAGPDVIRLAEGIHEGPLELRENGTVLYGEVSTDEQLVSILDGDLIIRGNDVRVRNLIVTGRVTVLGHNVSVAFCEVQTAVIRADGVVLLRDVLHSRPLVAGRNVLLLDVAAP